MSTINKYEQSMVEDTGGSSDKNGQLSLPTVKNRVENKVFSDYGLPIVQNGGEKVFSDFGQFFNGSKEENPSKKINVFDQSLTFTDENKMMLQKPDTKKYISQLELTADDLKYSKNSMENTANEKKAKMIKTIQNKNSERKFFSPKHDDEGIRSNPKTQNRAF